MGNLFRARGVEWLISAQMSCNQHVQQHAWVSPVQQNPSCWPALGCRCARESSSAIAGSAFRMFPPSYLINCRDEEMQLPGSLAFSRALTEVEKVGGTPPFYVKGILEYCTLLHYILLFNIKLFKLVVKLFCMSQPPNLWGKIYIPGQWTYLSLSYQCWPQAYTFFGWGKVCCVLV